MTREEAKQLLPVIQAWAEGKTIEIYDRKDEEWNTMTIEDPGFDCGPSCYRIKPKPKYRPFKDQEECWQEMQKHQPFRWTKLIGETGYSLIIDVDDEIFYSDAFKKCTFADGTPFGIREEYLKEIIMNNNIDLTKILKDCPEGTEFWSDNYGKVRFKCINTSLEQPVTVSRTDGYNAYYTKEGWYSSDFPASCLLWPSKDCRDWFKFTAPWYKKEKFDPKTLKPFDKVIVKNNLNEWTCAIFSHISDYNYGFPCNCCDRVCRYCIPYNDDTKHLVGTNEEAPEYYRYWED